MVPEQRVLCFATIGREQTAKVAATDQEIEAYYKANQQTYGGSETRDLTQAIVQSEGDARALAQKARGGAFNGSALKAVDRAKLADIAGDEVANAVFRAKAGEIVGPIHSDLGWVVIKVNSVSAASGKPLSAVKGEIAAKLTADKRKQALADMVGKIEDSLADGASLAEAARAAGLQVMRTPAITAGGVARSQPSFKLAPELAPAVKAGFSLGEGDEPVVETLSNDAGYALVGLEEIVSAAPAPLASIRDQVASNWKEKQALDKARSIASAIADKTSKGADMKTAIEAAGARLPPPQKVAKIRLELSAAKGKVPPALAMMFSLAQGRSRMVADPGNRGFVIVKVTKIVPGNASLRPGLISRTQTEFQQALQSEYAEQFVHDVQTDIGVKLNDSAIADAKRRITGGVN
jgi:peptidyl-prolyl cis-trans isomerase D